MTGVDGAWSYVVNGVKFDGFEIIKGILKALVDAKFGGSGYKFALNPDGTLKNPADPRTPNFVRSMINGLASQAVRQIEAVNKLPNPSDVQIFWVVNDAGMKAVAEAVLATVAGASDRITVVTQAAWEALKQA